MIVRISGADAHAIARKLAPNLSDRGSSAGLHRMSLDQMETVEFPAWVYYFRGPHSYTGEDLVELHIPGNAVLARMVLERVMALGAREAQAGEFTARAYFSRRMGLSQAEGVAATIAASNEQELRAARQLMSGELARRLRPVMDLVAETLALVEAGIDFSDQDVSFLGAEDGRARLNKALAMLRELVNQSARFERLSHEPTIVLVGRPNAGKSTLLNALAGSERAVVSNIAGTTRDVLSAEVRLSRGLVRVADVAGLEEAPVSGDSIAAQMQSRARQALETADHVVLVHEATDREAPIVVDRAVDLVVRTKGDLVNAHVEGEFIVSAKTGQGMDELRERLDRMAFGSSAAGSALALNARHLAAIAEAEEALVRGRDVVGPAGLEILALELREALDELGRVLGEMSPDDVLGRVFATFCIGK